MLAQVSPVPAVNPARFARVSEHGACTIDPVAQASCSGCRLQGYCLPSGLADGPFREFASVVFPHRRLKAGQALYRSGGPFDAVYLVRTGFVKTVVLLEDGREQVTGLCMPGDMLGMDGLASGRHASDAIALDDSEICVVPYDRLETLSDGARRAAATAQDVLSRDRARAAHDALARQHARRGARRRVSAQPVRTVHRARLFAFGLRPAADTRGDRQPARA